MLCILLAACSSPRPTPVAGTPSGPDAVDEIRLVALPVALNLDRRPGIDGFAVKVYGLSHNRPKPHEIRRGTIEIVMYDGLLPGGTNVVEPRCAWSFTADELRQYEMKSTIGLAYQLAPRWGEKKPQQNRITVMARYKLEDNMLLESAPSVITVPSQ